MVCNKRKRFFDTFRICGTDKKYMTGFDFLTIMVSLHYQWVKTDLFASYCFINSCSKRIIAQYPYYEWCIRRTECSSGPFNKLRKIEEESGFYLVLFRNICIRLCSLCV